MSELLVAKKYQGWLRPRFSLWALLVLITVIAIPLSYVAQRRSWNLRRKGAFEVLVKKDLLYEYSNDFEEPAGFISAWWRRLLLEDITREVREVDYVHDVHPADGSTGAPAISDADLRLLTYFPEIVYFHFMGPTTITDEGMRYVAQLPQLEELWLHESPGVTGEFLRAFDSTNVLKTLDLRLDDLQGEHLVGLQRLKSLETLSIESAAKLNEDSLNNVDLPSKISDLTLLFLRSAPEEPVCRWIRGCQLSSFQGCAMSSKSARTLADQLELEKLILFDSPLADEDLFALGRCTKLRELWLSALPIRGSFLKHLGAARELNDLRLECTLIDDAHLVHLTQFKFLQLLNLRWTPITGEGFSAIGEFAMPNDLRLMGTQFTVKGKAALCSWKGAGATSQLELPSNWTIEDFRYFIRDGRPPDSAILPIDAALAAGSTMKKFYSHYLASVRCADSKDSFENCGAGAMGLVIELRKSAIVKLEIERRMENDLNELESQYWAERKGLDGH